MSKYLDDAFFMGLGSQIIFKFYSLKKQTFELVCFHLYR